MIPAPDPRGEASPSCPLPSVAPVEQARFINGDHSDPHGILGAHPAEMGGCSGAVIRVFHPQADAVEGLPLGGGRIRLHRIGEDGLFEGFAPDLSPPFDYRLRFRLPGGEVWEQDDPYRFPPSTGELDLHLFTEGKHKRLWDHMGAHPRAIGGVAGVAFAVWAPNARRVSVVGDFCQWDGRRLPMRSIGGTGVFELFVPDLSPGGFYKYEIKSRDGKIRLKTDPFAFFMERAPGTASVVFESDYEWGDGQWVSNQRTINWAKEPLAIYEAHLESWDRVAEEGRRLLNYREMAARIVSHVKRLGFTHIELLPIAAHPFSGSWGYQVTGYYAPTARHGTPDDFRFFVDHCHQNGIGVILDWVPAHFPKDDFALARFDGTALYEHEDPLLGQHPDWGTYIFNYGRNEVRNFLIANALYWLDEFHVDGLRVDAVTSMLYLDYSRKEGEWRPNRFGGRENLEAVDFLKELNETIGAVYPGCISIAEESTAWPGVTRPVGEGGLGFTFKWNLGWMHDTLHYFSKDPVHRRYHHDRITFAMLYEYGERFVMPLSHDEVVHGKGSLLEKMPGDSWQRFANLRLLLTYQYTRPGKSLLFMGTELAPEEEWNHDAGLDWGLLKDPSRAAFSRFIEVLGRTYGERPAFWMLDHVPEGFQWIDCQDRENSVFSYIRRAEGETLLVVLNLTPAPRDAYRIGAPLPGRYVQLLSTDDPAFGGSGYETRPDVGTDPQGWHGFPQSLELTLPPLSGLILSRAP